MDEHLRNLVIQELESLRAAGVTHLPLAGEVLSSVGQDSASSKSAAAAPPVSTSPAEVTQPLRMNFMDDAQQVTPPEERPQALQVLSQEVAGCRRCTELAETRTQTVFGVGNPQARLCFLGEAPGADEDRQGEPFVGRAGQLLNRIIQACTLTREEVYILNVLKCRPPGNRNPSGKEAENCRGFLDRQLQIIRPEYLCCLGTVAAQSLLNTTDTIGRMRGKILDYQGIKVVCTYHPAYLLRNPSAKRQVWDDMQMLMAEMGIEIPK